MDPHHNQQQYPGAPQGQWNAPPGQQQYPGAPQGQWNVPPGQQYPPQQPQYGQPPPGQSYGGPPQQQQQQQLQGQYPPQQGQYPPQQQGQYPPQQQGQYPPPQGQYAPQQGQYPPQQGQYPPQQGQYPPQQGQFPPQQGQYPPQQGQYPPQQGQYPPPGQQGQYPPPGQQGQQGQYPPPGQQGQYPPQQQGQYPPQQGQYPPQQGQYPPQQGGYYQGQPPPGQGSLPPGGQYQGQQQQHYPPAPPSLGYDSKKAPAPVDVSKDIEGIRKAMKGMGTDEKKLIEILTRVRNPFVMLQISKDYNHRFMRDLVKDIKEETNGDLEHSLVALLRGPLEHDVHVLNASIDRAGTDEDSLMDVLLCRSNADLKIIQAEYKKVFHRDLSSAIKDDVGDQMFRLYQMVLKAERAEESAPVMPQDVEKAVSELQHATEGVKFGADTTTVSQVLTSHNDAQIRAIATEYERKYHRNLIKVIKDEFKGDMEDCLVRMVSFAIDPAKTDADSIHEPLKAPLRKDKLLINRIVRLYWNRPRMDKAKTAYRAKHGRDMASDIKEETSGDFERVLLAMIA